MSGAKDGLEEVDLAPNQKGGSHFFIEGSSLISLFTTLGMMVVFLAMHGYAAWKAPPLLAVKEDYFKLNSSEGNVSIDVDVTLSQLQDHHRFIAINASLVAKSDTLSKILNATVSTRKTSLKNFAIVKNDQDDRHPLLLTFKPGTNKSSGFFVDHSDVVGVDTLQVRLSMQTDYTGLDGFLFTWSFANPSAEKYSRSAKLLMSFLIGYMLVVFVFYLKFDSESFTQIFLLLVGLTGVLASNPFGLLFGESTAIRVADQVLLAVFVALVRLLILLEFEMLRKHEVKPGTLVVVLLVVTFALYAAVDATAGYERHSHVVHAESQASVVLQSESIAAICHVAYLAVGAIWFFLALAGNAGANSRRLSFFGLALLLSVIATLGFQVLCVIKNWLMYGVLRDLMFMSVHITIGSISIFLLHSGGGPEYTTVDEAKKVAEGEEVILGLDSDAGKDGPVSDEEEDGE